MPYIFKHRRPPHPWRMVRAHTRYRIFLPILYLEWLAEWGAYLLSRSSLLELLEYLGSLSIVIGVIFFFAEANDRLEQKHYQAWQVINTAQGRGGSGGRIDALQELAADGVPLVGIDVRDAYLQNVRLGRADLHRCNMSGADLRGADFSRANLEDSAFASANLRGADLSQARLARTDLNDADLHGATLRGADLLGVKLDGVDLSGADLSNILHWQSISSIRGASILGIQNPPDGFADWASAHGASTKPSN